MEYKVTNLTNDTRKFRNSRLGKDILVEPKKTIITKRPPQESSVWKVESHVEKTEEKKLKKEVISKKNGKKK